MHIFETESGRFLNLDNMTMTAMASGNHKVKFNNETVRLTENDHARLSAILREQAARWDPDAVSKEIQ